MLVRINWPLSIANHVVATIVPHQTGAGCFAWGTWATGANKGLRSDCTTGNQTGCMSLAWPGWQTSAWHEDGNPGENEYWMGSLVDGMRDASGQIYMRNRYYDPATGQFTQTDPIGLAGGLNAYGFAAGDPISFSDPYGLCPEKLRTADDRCPGNLSVSQYTKLEEGAATLAEEPRMQFLSMLMKGDVTTGELSSSRLAHVEPDWNGRHRIVVNTAAGGGTLFDAPNAGDVGWAIGHEVRHVQQFQGTTALGSAQAAWFVSGAGGILGDVYRAAKEIDADRYACANASQLVFSAPACN